MSAIGAGPILLIGAGRMGGALLKGWIARGVTPDRVFIQEPSLSGELAEYCKAHTIAAGEDVALPSPPEVIVLAVKPQLMDTVLPAIAPEAGSSTVILSIAAGRTISGLARHFPPGTAIIRAMPNTPAAIGKGISALYANPQAAAEQRAQCEALMAAAGDTVWLDDEAQMDAVTAVSGSGPAYVFLLAESLANAGVQAGLPRDLADKLAWATVSGAGDLMRGTGSPPDELRRNVTSPGGTTAAALDVLTAEGGAGHGISLGDLLAEAVEAAARRSRELAQ